MYPAIRTRSRILRSRAWKLISATSVVALILAVPGGFAKEVSLDVESGQTSFSGVRLSENGKTAARFGWDRSVVFYDVPSGKYLCTISGQSPDMAHGSLSADGQRFIEGRTNGEIIIWNVKDGTILRKLQSPDKGDIYAVALNADGKRIATISKNEHTITIFDGESGQPLHSLPTKPIPGATTRSCMIGLSGDGKVLDQLILAVRKMQVGQDSVQISTGETRIWDVESGSLIKTLPDTVVGSRLDEHGTRLLSDGGLVTKIWDPQTNQLVKQFDSQSEVLLDGGNLLFRCDFLRPPSGAKIGQTTIVDATTDNVKYNLDGIPCGAPDRRIIVTTPEEAVPSELWLWEASTGKKIQTFAGSRYSTTAMSRDDSVYAVAEENKAEPKHVVNLFDVRSGKKLRTIVSAPDEMSFSPDGKTLVCCESDDNSATMRLFDVESGREIHAVPGDRKVRRIVFTDDGSFFATACSGKYDVRLWDTKTAKKVRLFAMGPVSGSAGSESSIEDIAFSPDGKILYGCNSHSIMSFDAASGKRLATNDLDFFPNCFVRVGNDRLVCSGISRSIQVLDLKTMKPLVRACFPVMGGWANFGTDGKTFHTEYEGSVYQWEITSGKLVRAITLEKPVGGLSADLTCMAYEENGNVQIADVKTQRVLQTFPQRLRPIYSVSFVPGGRSIACGVMGQTIFCDPVTGKIQQVGNRGGKLAFSPDGSIVASLGKTDGNGKIQLWDVAKSCETRSMTVKDPLALSFSRDGKTLYCASASEPYFTAWDVSTGKEVNLTLGHNPLDGSVKAVCESPDGNMIAVGGSRLKIWDRAKGAIVKSFDCNSDALAFSPDGKMFAAGGESDTKKIRMWRTSDWQELHTLTGHTTYLQSLTFSPDNKFLVSGDMDGVARVWDTATGKEVKTLEHSTGDIALSFAPDGSMLVTAAMDGRLKVWDAHDWHNLCTFMPIGKADWVVMDGMGHFDASQAALPLIHGKLDGHPLPAEDLKKQFFEPGLFGKALSSQGNEGKTAN